MGPICFVTHPTYLEAIGVSADRFVKIYIEHISSELFRTHARRMSDLARSTAGQSDLGAKRVGLITLMAQYLPHTPREKAGLQEPAARAQFELSMDIVDIAKKISKSEAEELQIGRTYWELGRLARESFLPDLSVVFYTKAAHLYVIRRRWPQVADIYWNLGLAEGAAGDKGGAIGWLNLAAEVFQSLNNPQSAGEAITLAGDIRLNPAKYFATSVQLKALLDSGAAQSSNAVLAELYGLGLVSVSAAVPTAIDALLLVERFADALLQFVDQGWPTGLIAAQAVDIRVISRIFDRPALLDNLEPRGLETLIGILFEGFGAQVELTKQTRDGGYDVGATFELGDARYRILIEAKKWKRARKVGIASVDRLLGVRHRLRADKVMLVTTSTFSSIAHEVVAQLRCEIELVDRDGLSRWVAQYLLPSASSAITLPPIQPRS